jgi:nucleoside-diphosphate-sugar epimerase
LINKISILGCGWLGIPLAEGLIEKKFKVKGSTTSSDKISILASKNIEAYMLTVDDAVDREFSSEIAEFFDCDLLLINIPPRVRNSGDEYHPQQIKTIIRYAKRHKVKNIIYISATSIYPQDQLRVDENTTITVDNTGNKALFEAENLLRSETTFESLILRCGGLLGYNRIPGRYYSGKTITTGDTPVNYIHRDDVINIMIFCIENKVLSGLYNLVAPNHPSRMEVFSKNARDFGFEPPVFTENDENKEKVKMVIGKKLIEELGYQFLYPDPLHFHFTI